MANQRRSARDIVPTGRHSSHAPDKVVEVAAHYVVLGSLAKAADTAGVPPRTVHDWAHAPWWQELVEQIRADKSEELDALLTGLVHDAVGAAQDRIANGDHKLRSDGSIVRVPVSARDAMLTGAIAYDKRQIGRNLPTSITESTTDRLRLLMEQMRTVSGRTIEHDPTDQPRADQ